MRLHQEDAVIKEIMAVISKSLDLNEVIQEVLSKIIRMSKLTAGMIHFFDKHSKRLQLKAAQGLSRSATDSLADIEIAGTAFNKVARQGKPVLVKKVTPYQLKRMPQLLKELKSVALIPISVSGEISGVLTVGSNERVISEQQLPVLGEIGEKLGLARQQCKFYLELHRRIDDLNITNKVTESLAKTVDINERAAILADGLLEITQVDHVFVGLLEKKGERLRVVAESGINAGDLLKADIVISSKKGPLKNVIQKCVAETVYDAIITKLSQISGKIKHKSFACLPLIVQERTIGVATLSYIEQKHFFTQDEIDRIRPLLSQAAAMLENARLFTEINKVGEEYLTFINHSLDIIYRLDANGQVIEISPAAEQITGYKTSELVGKNFADFLEPEESLRVNTIMADLLSGKEPTKLHEAKLKSKSGRDVFVEFTIWTAVEEGRLTVQGIARDITEKRRVLAEIKQRNQVLDAVYRLGLKMGLTFDLEKETQIFLDNLKEVFPDIRTTLFFIDETRTVLSLVGSRGLLTGKKLKLPIGTDYSRWVCQLDADCTDLPEPYKIIFSLPVIVEGELIGLLCGIKSDLLPLNEDERRLLDILLAQAARIFRNIDKQRQLERANLSLEKSIRELHALSVADSEFLRVTEVKQYLKLLANELATSLQPSDSKIIIKADVEDETWIGCSDNITEKAAAAFEPSGHVLNELNNNVVAKVKDTKFKFDNQEIKSLMAAPITFERRVVGFLGLGYPQTLRAFPFEDESLIKSLSHQIGQFINRIMTERRLKEEKEISATLLKISSTLSGQMNRQTVLERITQIIPALTKCKRSSVFLYNERLQSYVPAGFYGFSEDMIADFKKLRFTSTGAPIINHLARFKMPEVIDVDSDQLIPKVLLEKFEAKNLLITPLISDARLVGAILIDSPGERHHFTSKDIYLVERIAKELVVVLNNLDLYLRNLEKNVDLAHKLRMLSVMHDIDLAVLSAQNQRQIMATICMNARELIPSDLVSINYYDRTRSGFVIQSVSSDFPTKLRDRFIPASDAVILSASIKGRPFYSSNLAVEERLGPADRILLDEGLLSILTVPLIVENNIYGSLVFASGKTAAFCRDDLDTGEKLSYQVAVAIKNSQLFAKIKEETERLQAVYRVTKDISAELSPEALPEKIAVEAMRLVGAKYGAVRIVDEKMETKQFIPVGITKDQAKLIGEIPRGRGILGIIIRERKPLRLANLTEHPESFGFPAHHPRMRTFLGVPIIYRDKIIGSIYLTEKKDGEFTKEDEDLVVSMASNIAVAIENANLFERLRAAYLASIQSLGAALEAKDPYFTFAHLERVQSYAVAIAKKINLSPEEIEGVRAAAFLHDIGKLGVSEETIFKEKDLTDDEWAAMHQHPDTGGKILRHIKFPWRVKPLIRAHHEHYDGTGYPEGLEGERIPLGARIIAVADAWDSMNNERSYRSALTREEAKQELNKNRGSQFDPDIVDIFLKILDEEESQKRAA